MVVSDTDQDFVGGDLTVIRDTPLEAKFIDLGWISREQASMWYSTAPDLVPREALKRLVVQYDRTEATPPFFDSPATTSPEANGRTPEDPAYHHEVVAAPPDKGTACKPNTDRLTLTKQCSCELLTSPLAQDGDWALCQSSHLSES